MTKKWKHFALFSAGGWVYCIVELIWRRHTHWTMFFVGGACFVLIGLINEFFPQTTSLLAQMIIASVLVSAAELVCGCVLNLWLKWNVWDYSAMPYNLAGQICLLYAVWWFFLSLPAILLDDFIRWSWMNEDKPIYRLL